MRTLYAACVALSITPATFADTTMEFDSQGDSGQPTRIVIKGNRVLMLSGDGEDMLYDASLRNVTMIDHQRRGYYVMDPQSMAEATQHMQARGQQSMAAGMQQMQQHIQALLDNPDIPPEQKEMYRKEMEKMMASMGSAGAPASGGAPQLPPMRIEPLGESRKVAGIKCRMFLVSRGDEATEEVCVASRKAAGVPEGDYETLRDMFGFMREMAEQSMAAMGAGGGGPAFPDYDGVPVQTTDLEDGSVSTLRTVSTKSVADSIFAIPSGYRKHDPFQ